MVPAPAHDSWIETLLLRQQFAVDDASIAETPFDIVVAPCYSRTCFAFLFDLSTASEGSVLTGRSVSGMVTYRVSRNLPRAHAGRL